MSIELTSATKNIEAQTTPPQLYNYDKKFVEQNLIAYIGNKCRLLNLIINAIKSVEKEGSTPVNRTGLFIDLFSGSGVVARLAKSLGFSVWANDWEEYSYVINQAFLGLNEADLAIFNDEGGLDSVLAKLNQLTEEGAASYIAKYYCPQDDTQPNCKTERMFYTHQNGVLIDNIREVIEKKYPLNSLENTKKKNLLTALLLIQTSKRSNTSGVFKGFHHGFGGKNGDALSRILSPVKLERPTLHSSPSHSSPNQQEPSKVFRQDALVLIKSITQKAEIVYLDPPYNQHQYGSNYHLLNTIAKNDRPKVRKEFIINGKKINKSAIRKDWKKTKSAYCSTKTATNEFTALIAKVSAKYIMVSYSDEGFIEINQMIDILASRGKVKVVTSSYTRYKGGRQSNQTENYNIEFVLIVDTQLKCTNTDIQQVKNHLFNNKVAKLMKESFPLHQFSNHEVIPLTNQKVSKYRVFWRALNLELDLDAHLHITPKTKNKILRLPFKKKQTFFKTLHHCMPNSNEQRVISLLLFLQRKKLIKANSIKPLYFIKQIIRYFKKINPTKEPELIEDLKLRINATLANYKIDTQKTNLSSLTK